MNKADACYLEASGGRLGSFRLCRNAVALKAAMNLAARELGVHATPQNLDDVIERQFNAGAKFDRKTLFDSRHRGSDAMRPVRAVGNIFTGFPARDGSRADAQLLSKIRNRCLALLNVGPRLGCRGRVRVKPHVHDLRCSLK